MKKEMVEILKNDLSEMINLNNELHSNEWTDEDKDKYDICSFTEKIITPKFSRAMTDLEISLYQTIEFYESNK